MTTPQGNTPARINPAGVFYVVGSQSSRSDRGREDTHDPITLRHSHRVGNGAPNVNRIAAPVGDQQRQHQQCIGIQVGHPRGGGGHARHRGGIVSHSVGTKDDGVDRMADVEFAVFGDGMVAL